MPKIIAKVDSNIRRYRARFCKRLADGKLTNYHLAIVG
jgi:hypothetical protein